MIIDRGTPSDGLEPWDRFLTRLPPGSYRSRGQGKWMCKCPAHQDNNPSLSVEIAEDGKLLLWCFAGCSTEDVLAAVGLEFRDVFPEGLHPQCGRAGRPLNGSGRPRTATPRVTQEQVEKAAQNATGAARALNWTPADEWIRKMRLPDWLVPGFIERGSLNTVIGGWGSGKSAIELDRCLHIVHGLSWQGLEPQEPELVVYVCGEGQSGFQRRIAAWHQHHGLEPTRNLVIIPEAVLIGQPDHEAALGEALFQIQERYARRVGLVVLDTMARCFGLKDESSNSDVAMWVNLIQAHIIAPTGAAVVILHHPGHTNKDRGRGASALPGAADTEWLVERSGDQVVMRCTKSKDTDPPKDIGWRIFGVEIVIEEVGITAPVVEAVDVKECEEGADSGVLGELSRLLGTMHRDACEVLEAQGRAGHEAKIDRDSWYNRAVECGLTKSRNNFRLQIHRAQQAGLVRRDGVHFYPVKPVDNF